MYEDSSAKQKIRKIKILVEKNDRRVNYLLLK